MDPTVADPVSDELLTVMNCRAVRVDECIQTLYIFCLSDRAWTLLGLLKV